MRDKVWVLQSERRFKEIFYSKETFSESIKILRMKSQNSQACILSFHKQWTRSYDEEVLLTYMNENGNTMANMSAKIVPEFESSFFEYLI